MNYRAKKLSLILWLTLLMVWCSTAFADPVTLLWDANTETDLKGYRVYYGTASGSYGPPIPILGNNPTYTFTNLPLGTYFFAVTAINEADSESGYSNEVSTTITSGPPTVTCDINSNGFTDALDLQMLINVILGIQGHVGNLDMNFDGRINGLDLQVLANVVLGERSCP